MASGIFLCEFCEHLQPLGKCKAFPKGIPDKVFYGGQDHRLPVRGDHGIRFQLATRFLSDKELQVFMDKHLPTPVRSE